MKNAAELLIEGLRIKESHTEKLDMLNTDITKRNNEEVMNFIDDVVYFCENAEINKEIQQSLKDGIKFIPGNPSTVLDGQLEKLRSLIK
ncbi:hypothetical protein [Sporosarcina sp. FSL W7-1283]|uniref:hypothetical protein n=1 Tax=Sporosarcina sp. FSL W7-1283 TaxID=2921560 RepID=UPI0030F8F8D8